MKLSRSEALARVELALSSLYVAANWTPPTWNPNSTTGLEQPGAKAVKLLGEALEARQELREPLGELLGALALEAVEGGVGALVRFLGVEANRIELRRRIGDATEPAELPPEPKLAEEFTRPPGPRENAKALARRRRSIARWERWCQQIDELPVRRFRSEARERLETAMRPSGAKRGRPARDPKGDERLLAAWNTGRWKDRTRLSDHEGISLDALDKALRRARDRRRRQES